MALNSATLTSSTSSGNRGNGECSEGPFRGSFDEDFVLLIFLLLFGIGTVVIGLGVSIGLVFGVDLWVDTGVASFTKKSGAFFAYGVY